MFCILSQFYVIVNSFYLILYKVKSMLDIYPYMLFVYGKFTLELVLAYAKDLEWLDHLQEDCILLTQQNTL